MTVKHVTGDLFALDVDAIGHGVNCKGVMGAGIAVAFKDKFPMMYHDYQKLCYMMHLWPGQVFVWRMGDKTVYNIASQYEPGADASYDALATALLFVRFDAERYNLKSVALPQIGCGIGGLEWQHVSRLMTVIFSNSPVEFQLVTYGE